MQILDKAEYNFMEKRTLRVLKGADQIAFPFKIDYNSPWQDQVREQLNELHNLYEIPQTYEVDFNITSSEWADIIVRRKK
jgi:hypothetical protein